MSRLLSMIFSSGHEPLLTWLHNLDTATPPITTAILDESAAYAINAQPVVPSSRANDDTFPRNRSENLPIDVAAGMSSSISPAKYSRDAPNVDEREQFAHSRTNLDVERDNREIIYGQDNARGIYQNSADQEVSASINHLVGVGPEPQYNEELPAATSTADLWSASDIGIFAGTEPTSADYFPNPRDVAEIDYRRTGTTVEDRSPSMQVAMSGMFGGMTSEMPPEGMSGMMPETMCGSMSGVVPGMSPDMLSGMMSGNFTGMSPSAMQSIMPGISPEMMSGMMPGMMPGMMEGIIPGIETRSIPEMTSAESSSGSLSEKILAMLSQQENFPANTNPALENAGSCETVSGANMFMGTANAAGHPSPFALAMGATVDTTGSAPAGSDLSAGDSVGGHAASSSTESLFIPMFRRGRYVLGELYGKLSPNSLALSILRHGASPLEQVCRRFVVDLSAEDMLEFVEYEWFSNGLLVVSMHEINLNGDYQGQSIVLCTFGANDNADTRVSSRTPSRVLMRMTFDEKVDCPACMQPRADCRCRGQEPAKQRILENYKNSSSWSTWVAALCSTRKGNSTNTASITISTPMGDMKGAQTFRLQQHCSKGRDVGAVLLRRKYAQTILGRLENPYPEVAISDEDIFFTISQYGGRPDPADSSPQERLDGSIHGTHGERSSASSKKSIACSCGRIFTHRGHYNVHVLSVHMR